MDTPGDDIGELSFDKATYAQNTSAGGTPCANCNGSLGEQYWQWQARSVCATCRGQISAMLQGSQSSRNFGRAILLGSAAALGCGIAYAIFVALFKFQFALVTIGIAFAIAKVMRYCSAGVGGRKYQILAVVLTYVASAMGYAPAVLSSVSGGDKADVKTAPQPAAATTETKDSSAPAAPDPKRPTRAAEDEPMGLGGIMLGLALIFGITLAAPLLAATEAPLGVLIVGFGLWEAWKLSRGLPLTLDGPYRAGAAAIEPAAT